MQFLEVGSSLQRWFVQWRWPPTEIKVERVDGFNLFPKLEAKRTCLDKAIHAIYINDQYPPIYVANDHPFAPEPPAVLNATPQRRISKTWIFSSLA